MKQIAVFSDSSIDTEYDIVTFKSWEEFSNNKTTIAGFYISASCSDIADELIKEIRSSEFWYYLVYTEDLIQNRLFDGEKSLKDAFKSFKFSQELLSKLKLNIKALKREEKLLLYLYLREDYELIPEFHPKTKKLYKYPILEFISQTSNDSWVYELTAKSLLTFSKIVDRVRLCNQCQSAHLYFIDLCPQCKSINIKESKILHCFSCGYVDEEKQFQKDAGLVCPKCLTQLKLIGVDYDLPASEYKCYDCSYIFKEPYVVARCMDCSAENEPDKLNIEEFHKLKLSLQGQEYLLLDQKNVIFSMFAESLKHIKIDEFKLFLNWMTSVFKRDSTFHFLVVLLEFDNMHKFINYYGFTKTNEIMEELSRRILELLRETDMLSMDDEHRLWILLPTTSKKGIEERLLNILHELKIENGPQLSVKLKTFYTIKNPLKEKSNAKTIMNDLLQSEENK
ncbi:MULTISPECIES: diguanylate cyclase [Sulfurimonas]|uniref:TackOD1 domain-containing metal-binding protein n=1 Tax=Sulfurimonas TaxID=202746 RepID=UPI001264ABC0|nr:diguanylate cyclase [Sulfurimonas indica]